MGRNPQGALLVELDTFISEDLPNFLMYATREVLIPILILLICFGGALKILLNTQKKLYPPPKHVRHKEIMKLYGKGKVDEALEAFAKLEYGRSYLSIACHYIYVVGTQESVAKGIMLLKEAQDLKLGVTEKQIKEMRADAAAIMSGNAVMVRTNAAVQKEEYLGIASW